MIFFHYCNQKITAAIRGRPNTSGCHIQADSNMIRPTESCGRRAFFSSLMFTATSVPHGRDALLKEYLERSRENKAKHDKERLDDYYKRNYKDYFEFVEGSSQGKSEDLLSESDKEIREWLRRNQK